MNPEMHRRSRRRRSAFHESTRWLLVLVIAVALGLGYSLAGFIYADTSAEDRLYLPFLTNACGSDKNRCLTEEIEDNNRRQDAGCQPLLCEGAFVPGSILGHFDTIDLYRIFIPGERTVRIEIELIRLPLGVEYILGLYEGNGNRLEEGHPVGHRRVIQQVLERGVYYVGVFPGNAQSVSTEPYAVRWVTAKVPKLLSPEDETTVFSPPRTAMLDWESVLADEYEIAMHNDHDPKNPGWRRTFQAGEPPFVTPPLPFVGEYWWQVRAIGDGASADASGEYMFTLCDHDLIQDLKAKGSETYVVGCEIAVDDRYYTDRRYQIETLPSELAGLPWIRTANADAHAIDDDFLSFTVKEPVKLFIAYAKPATSLPNWLTTFIKTDLEIGVTDRDLGSFAVYVKDFPAGSITLGANSAPEAGGAGSNYVVLAKPR